MQQTRVSQQVLQHLQRVYRPKEKRVPLLSPGTWDLEIGRLGSVTYVAMGPLPYKKPVRQFLGLAEDLLRELDDQAEWFDCPNCTKYHRKGDACYQPRRRRS